MTQWYLWELINRNQIFLKEKNYKLEIEFRINN